MDNLSIGNLDIKRNERYQEERVKEQAEEQLRKYNEMIDYDALYMEFLYYLGDKFDITMDNAAIHAEQLTEIAKQRVEGELSDEE